MTESGGRGSINFNVDFTTIEYIGQSACSNSSNTVFNLPKAISSYKYFIIFTHFNTTDAIAALSSGIALISPADIYNNIDHKMSIQFFTDFPDSRYIKIPSLNDTTLTITLTAPDSPTTGSYQRLYGIY